MSRTGNLDIANEELIIDEAKKAAAAARRCPF